MEVDGVNTRHCCEVGKYWDPSEELCADADLCHDPLAINDSPCQYIFPGGIYGQENASLWQEDVFNVGVDDCVIEDVIPMEACCSVEIYGEQTYEYVDVTYYEFAGFPPGGA